MKDNDDNKRPNGRRVPDAAALRSALLDEIAEGVFVWNKSGKCTEVNRTACSMLGYKREEILGVYFLDFIHKDDLASSVLNPDALVHSRLAPVYAHMHQKNGDLLPVEIRQRLLSDGSVAAIITDVTSQRRTEEEIRNINRLYATLSGINHAIVRTKKRESIFDAVCEVAVDEGDFGLAFVGLLDEEGQNISLVSWRASDGKKPSYTTLDIDRPPLNRSILSDSVRTGRVITSNSVQSFTKAQFPEMTEPVRTFNSAACVPIREKGKVIGVVMLGRNDARGINEKEKGLFEEIGEDISFALDAIAIDSERRRAQRELVVSEEKFRTIMEQMNDAVIVVNAAGDLAFVSQAVERIIGYKSAEVIGRHFNVFVVQEDKGKASKEFTRVIKTGESSRSIELRLKKKDGSATFCEVDATPYRSGRSIGILGVVRDISERKKAEEELRLVEAKRKELEGQLIQSQRLESLGTLAGGIAHDFNNLLGIIMGYSMILRRRKPDDVKFEKSLESIHMAAERGASLVRQLLTIARKTETVFEPVNVNDVIEEIVELLSKTFPKTIIITSSLRENVPTVIADASQLHQLFMNLSINSRDAMPLGGTLYIATSVVEGGIVRERFPGAESRRYVVVQVADTGTGMNEDTKRKIFDPFFTTKMPGKGTGLGLALVYSIVNNHQGLIEVESEEGNGTVFNLYFPVDRSETERPVSPEVERKEIPGGNETILVIEDEEMLLDIVRSFLVPKGYSVFTARDGEEGVRVYSEHKASIAMAIVDLGLPKMSGELVVSRIMSMDPAMRVIIASGYVDPEVQESLMKNGVRSFILKPYSALEVLRTVREVLDSKV